MPPDDAAEVHQRVRAPRRVLRVPVGAVGHGVVGPVLVAVREVRGGAPREHREPVAHEEGLLQVRGVGGRVARREVTGEGRDVEEPVQRLVRTAHAPRRVERVDPAPGGRVPERRDECPADGLRVRRALARQLRPRAQPLPVDGAVDEGIVVGALPDRPREVGEVADATRQGLARAHRGLRAFDEATGERQALRPERRVARRVHVVVQEDDPEELDGRRERCAADGLADTKGRAIGVEDAVFRVGGVAVERKHPLHRVGPAAERKRARVHHRVPAPDPVGRRRAERAEAVHLVGRAHRRDVAEPAVDEGVARLEADVLRVPRREAGEDAIDARGGQLLVRGAVERPPEEVAVARLGRHQVMAKLPHAAVLQAGRRRRPVEGEIDGTRRADFHRDRHTVPRPFGDERALRRVRPPLHALRESRVHVRDADADWLLQGVRDDHDAAEGDVAVEHELVAQRHAVECAVAAVAERVVNRVRERQPVGTVPDQGIRRELVHPRAVLGGGREHLLLRERLAADVVQLEEPRDVRDLRRDAPGLVEVAAHAEPLPRVRQSVRVKPVDRPLRRNRRDAHEKNSDRRSHFRFLLAASRSRSEGRPLTLTSTYSAISAISVGSSVRATGFPRQTQLNGCRRSVALATASARVPSALR